MIDDKENLDKMDNYIEYPFVMNTIPASIYDRERICSAIDKIVSSKHEDKSVNYKRVHNVPQINWIKFVLNITIPIFVILIMYFFLVIFFGFFENKSMVLLSLLLLYMIYICIRMKSIVIWVVKAYQHFAPIKIRDKCRFELSCSEYMIMSVEKYGVIKGIKKRIKQNLPLLS